MYCNACGSLFKDGLAYCPFCGESLVDAEPVEVVSSPKDFEKNKKNG